MKSLFEEMGGTYHEQNGYVTPDLALPSEKEKTVSIYGHQHLQYLKEYQRVRYISLLTSGRLNAYLANVDKQAEGMLFRLVKAFAEKQEVTEQLKSNDQLEWTGRMKAIHNMAREIVNAELIYS